MFLWFAPRCLDDANTPSSKDGVDLWISTSQSKQEKSIVPTISIAPIPRDCCARKIAIIKIFDIIKDHLPMCFDERTSWATFIVGTLLNLLMVSRFKGPEVIAIAVLWQFVLLMQVFEALAWRTQSRPGSRLHSFATNGAMIANVMQPIVVGLVFLALLGGSMPYKLAAVVLMVGYVAWLIYSLNTSPNVSSLQPKEGCTHLNLSWWDNFSFKGINGAVPYLVCLFGLLILLLRPLGLMWFEASYIFVTLIISAYFYSCGTGSMWCWLAAFAPLFTMGYLKYSEKR